MQLYCIILEYMTWEKFKKPMSLDQNMFPPGIEPGTLRVWGARDNRYTTETSTNPISNQASYVYSLSCWIKYYS